MQCLSRFLVPVAMLAAMAMSTGTGALAQDAPIALPQPGIDGSGPMPPAAPGSPEAPMFVPTEPGALPTDGTHWHGEPLPGALPAPITDEFCGACCEVSCDGWHEAGCWTRLCCWLSNHSCANKLCSTCDMLPHYPYFPTHHGYYHLRPYNFTYVQRQREWVASYGGDERAPYSNEFLKDRFAVLDIPSRADSRIRSRQLPSLPSLSDELPDLEELLNAPEEAPPTPGDVP